MKNERIKNTGKLFTRAYKLLKTFNLEKVIIHYRDYKGNIAQLEVIKKEKKRDKKIKEKAILTFKY